MINEHTKNLNLGLEKIPVTVQMAKYEEALSCALAKALSVAKEGSSDGWTVFSDRDGVLLEQKSYDFCPINFFRATTLLDMSPEEAMKKVWDMSLAVLQEIDPNITKVETLESYDENTRVRVQENKLPWPIWPRQTVFAEKKTATDDGIWDVAVSVEHSGKPLDANNFVRAVLHVGGYGFIKEGDKTRMWRFIHVDPCGSIPAMVVNAGADSVAAACRYFKK